MSRRRVFIIAEAGVNHNGSPSLASELVEAAAEAGADAVKFQTFSADKLVLKSAPKADYQVANTGTDDSQYAMLKALELDIESTIALREQCEKRGIEFMSSPFDPDSVDFLAKTIGVARLKIPSGEVINGPLMLRAARTRLPLIVSSGMCTLEEVLDSLSLLVWAEQNPAGVPRSADVLGDIQKADDWTAALRDHVWLLQCVTQYPAPADVTNLRAMHTLAEATGLTIGFSDHSLGWHIPLAAVAMGAQVVEKHFTLSRDLPGPDHVASLEPGELARLVREIRDVEAALGDGAKKPNATELKNRLPARGSIVAASPIEPGALFTAKNITVKRPATGLSPTLMWDLIGKKARRAYEIDDQIGTDEIGVR